MKNMCVLIAALFLSKDILAINQNLVRTFVSTAMYTCPQISQLTEEYHNPNSAKIKFEFRAGRDYENSLINQEFHTLSIPPTLVRIIIFAATNAGTRAGIDYISEKIGDSVEKRLGLEISEVNKTLIKEAIILTTSAMVAR